MSARPDAIDAGVIDTDGAVMKPGPRLSTRELDRKASSSLFWQGAKISIHLLQYVVLARLVVPEEFGKFALAVPLFLVLSAINDGGLSTATVTGKRYDARLASSLWLTQVGLGVAMAAIMLLSSPLLAVLFKVPDLVAVGGWLALSLFIESWGLQSRANLRREMRIGSLALVEIGGLALGVTAALIAAHWTHGVAVLVVAQIAAAAARTIIAFASAPLRPHAFQATAEYRNALRTGWNVVGSDLLNILRVQCPTLVIGFFLLLSEVGLFTRANQLLNVPLTMLAPAMANFLLPLLSRTREVPAEFRQHVRRSQRLFLAVAIPVSVWIAMGPAHLIVLALGAEWAPVVPILQCLSPLFMSQVIATVARMTLLASEESRVDRFFALLNLVLTAAAVLAAAPFGVFAVALALSLSGVALRAPLLTVLAVRKRTLARSDVIDGLRVIAMLAVVSAVAAWACRLLPVIGVAKDVLGLVAAAAISAGALAIIVRQPQPQSGAAS